MKISIGSFDADTGTVPVTFSEGGIVHRRTMNAVTKADGGYDRAATRSRAEDVGLGVAVKIAEGVIGGD